MTNKNLVMALLFLLMAAPSLQALGDEVAQEAVHPNIVNQQAELAVTSHQLDALGPFVSFAPGRIASLDVSAARAAGFSEETLQLAQEMVDAQNELLESLRSRAQGDRHHFRLNLTDRDALAHFIEVVNNVNLATSSGYLAPLAAGSTNACGTFDNPVPSSAGPRVSQGTFKSRKDGASYLYKLGFHDTAWYVNTADFTRGRSYSSTWGTCSKPRFRDQGTISSKFLVQIQYGECNPEVFSYSWPYWNWPSYCSWWHNTH